MEELNTLFNDYVDKFKQMDINSKRKEFLDVLKEFLAMLSVISNNEGLNVDYLKSRDILDIKRDEITEDDFIEACLVYLENSKNIIGALLENKVYNDVNK